MRFTHPFLLARPAFLYAAILLTGFAIIPLSAHADPITVVNGDFQTTATPLAPGSAENIGIPGWDVATAGDGGQWIPTSHFFAGANDTNIIAYSEGSTISQTVAATVQAGTVYTLTVEIGFRSDEFADGGADLLIDGTQYLATGTKPTNRLSGTFSTFTAVYSGTAADAGKAITIELTSNRDESDGDPDFAAQGDFDNVALNTGGDSSSPPPVPEPATLWYVGTGTLALAGAVRRRFLKG